MENSWNKFVGGISVSFFAGACMPLWAQSPQPNLVYIFPDQYRLPAPMAALLKRELGRWLEVSEDPWAKERKFADRIRYDQ